MARLTASLELVQVEIKIICIIIDVIIIVIIIIIIIIGVILVGIIIAIIYKCLEQIQVKINMIAPSTSSTL